MARRDRRRTTGALATSILVHLALFLMLLRVAGSSPPVSQTRAGTDFQVQLVTQPSPATPSAQTAEAPPPRALRQAPRPVVRLPSPRPRIPPQRPASPPSPASAKRPPALAAPALRAGNPAFVAGAPSGAASKPGGAAQGRWSVQGGDEDEGGVRRFLRATVGCSHQDYAGLSDGERAACDRRIGQEARSMGIAPDKLAGFIAAAQAQERQRADRTGPMRDLFVPCKGEGSNLDRGCIDMRPKPPQDEP